MEEKSNMSVSDYKRYIARYVLNGQKETTEAQVEFSDTMHYDVQWDTTFNA
jgi:hypothetical protein